MTANGYEPPFSGTGVSSGCGSWPARALHLDRVYIPPRADGIHCVHCAHCLNRLNCRNAIAEPPLRSPHTDQPCTRPTRSTLCTLRALLVNRTHPTRCTLCSLRALPEHPQSHTLSGRFSPLWLCTLPTQCKPSTLWGGGGARAVCATTECGCSRSSTARRCCPHGARSSHSSHRPNRPHCLNGPPCLHSLCRLHRSHRLRCADRLDALHILSPRISHRLHSLHRSHSPDPLNRPHCVGRLNSSATVKSCA